jgi:hypothetical protein
MQLQASLIKFKKGTDYSQSFRRVCYYAQIVIHRPIGYVVFYVLCTRYVMIMQFQCI